MSDFESACGIQDLTIFLNVYNVTHTLNSAKLWFLVEKIFREPKLSILVVWNTESSFNPLNTNPTKFQTHSKNFSSTADELFEFV